MFVHFGLLGIRTPGLSQQSRFFTALETIATNLFWIPLLVGWINEKYR